MNEKLIVKNFGSIKNAELDLKKVTIFIGPQGSGKSTLAKLVAICKEEERPFLRSEPSNVNYRESYYGLKPFKKENSFFEYSSDFFILSNSGNNVYSGGATELGLMLKNEIEIINDKLEIDLNNPNIDDLTKESSRFAAKLGYTNIFYKYNITSTTYIPDNRSSVTYLSSALFGLMNNDVNLPKILTAFGNKYSIAGTHDAKDDMRFVKAEGNIKGSKKPKYIELFDLQFQHRDGQDFLIDTKKNFEINLKDSASGMQSTIPLILVVRYEYNLDKKHFIVEEPELNLFPTTRKQLVGYLADKCTQNGNELLMTTHSPYVLSAINNLIFAYKVAHEVPKKAEEVAKIIPREQWLNPDDVAAYYVADGTVKSIIDESEGLIGENELDAISEDISGERDQLFKILRSKKRETVH